jgi:hypothetical protein
VAEHGHGPTRLGGEHLGDRDDVLELSLDRIRRGVARFAATAPIVGFRREAARQAGREHPERGVVGRRSVDEHDRRACSIVEAGDAGA